LVTVSTVERGVTQLKCVSGFEMLERALVQTSKVELWSEVILVTVGAAVRRKRRVVPPVRRDSRAQLLMAVETTLRRDPALSQLMA